MTEISTKQLLEIIKGLPEKPQNGVDQFYFNFGSNTPSVSISGTTKPPVIHYSHVKFGYNYKINDWCLQIED